MARLQVRMERRRITEWRDDAVYRTESEGIDWYDDEEVRGNKPRETSIIYCPPSGDGSMLQNFRMK